MDYSHILRNVAKHISLSEPEKDLFVSLLSPKKVKKKEFILEEGEVCDSIHYIAKGVFRAFYRDKESRESDVMFGIDDWWITDMFSFTTGKPAMLFIEAIEDSVVLGLKRKMLDQLFVDVPKFERFFRIIMQNSYVREQLRTVQNLSMTARQRYDHFMKKYPEQALRIPQKYIASYLGMTPEFLSSIRKK